MRTTLIACSCLLSLVACDDWTPVRDDGGTPGTSDLQCPAPPDMATPAPKCAAAKGLPGDNLLCVDFKDVQMLSSLGGWDFSCTGGTSWTTTGGKLQVNNFSTFMSTCTFTLPALSAADYQKYSSFTLSVVQRVDLNNTQQRAQILLGADDQDSRLLDWRTGKQPRQRSVYDVAKIDLPLAAVGNFQPLFKLFSGIMPNPNLGWQIESIAVQGIP